MYHFKNKFNSLRVASEQARFVLLIYAGGHEKNFKERNMFLVLTKIIILSTKLTLLMTSDCCRKYVDILRRYQNFLMKYNFIYKLRIYGCLKKRTASRKRK